MPRGLGYNDLENQKLLPNAGGLNADALIRSGFVRKVYGILSIQLLVTFGIVTLFQFSSGVRAALCRPPFTWNVPTADDWKTNEFQEFAKNNKQCFVEGALEQNPPSYALQMSSSAAGLMYGAWAVSFVLIIALVCCIENARVYPRNMILLGLFTVAEGLFVGTMCAFVQGSAVLLGIGMCAGVVLGLTAFACTTKIDFTGMGAYLFAALLVFVMFGFIASLFGFSGHGNTLQLLYACAGCLIFSMYIVYDTQLILGGQHKKFQFEVDDYIFAALNLYLDIINLFIYIVSILQSRD